MIEIDANYRREFSEKFLEYHESFLYHGLASVGSDGEPEIDKIYYLSSDCWRNSDKISSK